MIQMTADTTLETMEARSKWHHFSNAERKELSTQNSVPSENTLQERRVFKTVSNLSMYLSESFQTLK